MPERKKITIKRISEGSPIHLKGFGIFATGDCVEVPEDIAEYLINGGHFALKAKAKKTTEKKKDK